MNILSKKELIKLFVFIIILLSLFYHLPQKLYGLIKLTPYPKEIEPAYEYLIKCGFIEEAELLKQSRIKFVDRIGYEHLGFFKAMTKTYIISSIYLEKDFYFNRPIDEQCLILLHELTHVKQDRQLLSLPFLFTWVDHLPRKLIPLPHLRELFEFEALLKEIEYWQKLSMNNTTWAAPRVRKLLALNHYGKEILNDKWVRWDDNTINWYIQYSKCDESGSIILE